MTAFDAFLHARIFGVYAWVGLLVGLLIVYLVCILIRDRRDDDRNERRNLAGDPDDLTDSLRKGGLL